MKPASRNVYQRVQSSDDSEESSTPLHKKTTGNTPGHPQPSPPNGSSSEDDPKIEDDLKELAATQAHQTSNALERAKKTVLIEIKGKSPPGKDGVFALNRDLKPQSLIEDTHASNSNAANSDLNPNQARKYHTNLPSFVDYGSTMPSAHPGSMLHSERLIGTRKVAKNTTLDRVKRLQERAGMMDVKERIQERRDRCGAVLHQSRLGGYNNAQRFKPTGFTSMLTEKPVLAMDAKREGVLKISDRSFCENGGWHARVRHLFNGATIL